LRRRFSARAEERDRDDHWFPGEQQQAGFMSPGDLPAAVANERRSKLLRGREKERRNVNRGRQCCLAEHQGGKEKTSSG